MTRFAALTFLNSYVPWKDQPGGGFKLRTGMPVRLEVAQAAEQELTARCRRTSRCGCRCPIPGIPHRNWERDGGGDLECVRPGALTVDSAPASAVTSRASPTHSGAT